jgi:hypothetical protein
MNNNTSKLGRPTSLTVELQREICEHLADAIPIATTCELVGIAPSTFHAWINRGESGEAPYSEFRDEVTCARARAKLMLLRIIDRAAENGDWRAASWRLRVGWPQEFSDRPPPEKKTASPPPQWEPVPDEELRKILANLP